MKQKVFKGNVVLSDRVLEGGAVVVEGERIVGIFPSAGSRGLEGGEVRDYGDHYVAPGLIDIHLHGALGKDVMDASVDGLKKIASHQARCGVTGFVPTTLVAPLPSVKDAVENIRAAMMEPLSSEILGLYLEGPFLSRSKKGAQNPAFIRPVGADDLAWIREICRGLKTIVTIAPEVGDNMRFIPLFRDGGLIVSIGHSDAAYDLAIKSFEQGVTHATHLYNAMSAFLPREPGVIGAVLDSDAVTAELIADGIHIHPAALRLAVRQKGVDRICLVTDSVNAAGLGDGEYQVGGLDVIIKADQARLKDGGALAGSVLTLNKSVKNILQWTGLSVPQAFQMASLTPARVLGLDGEIGSLEAGKLANLAVFNKNFDVVASIRRGRPCLHS